MMSIEALLQAAEYLDRREREAEHGYASTLRLPETDLKAIRSNRAKVKKFPQGTRSTHNELEKNRRAHLRHCLDRLKDMVPLGPESNRHTTLGLLTKARHFIKNLEIKDKKQQEYKNQLYKEQKYLLKRLEQLSMGADPVEISAKQRYDSETSSISSSESLSSYDIGEEVDIVSSAMVMSPTDSLGSPLSSGVGDEVDVHSSASSSSSSSGGSDSDDQCYMESEGIQIDVMGLDGSLTLARRLVLHSPPAIEIA